MAGLLNNVIKSSGMKKQVLAQRMGVSYPTFVSKIKRPETMTVAEAVTFCKGVNISMIEFVSIIEKEKGDNTL